MAVLRADGMALSMGELDPGVGAAAVPIFNGEGGADGEVVGALALVGTVAQLQAIGPQRLRQALERTSGQIRQALAQAALHNPGG
jgi:DNA-binding IclR family transcriptional regulator